jgi:hypothetical protein
MSAERFVIDARRALGSLVVTGAMAARQDTVQKFRILSSRSRGLGLSDLALCLEELARELARQRPLTAEDRLAIAGRILRIHDRVEALDSALVIASVENLSGPHGDGPGHATR